jgi:hypothetical protein
MKYFINEIFHFKNTACILFSLKKDFFANQFFHFGFIAHMIFFAANIINLKVFIVLLIFFLQGIIIFLFYQYQ